MTVNCGGSENDSACRRMIRWAIAWKVPPVIRPLAGRAHPAARDRMSSAARRVKVSSRIREGSTPWSHSQAARTTSVRVFPVPAPASTSSGPPGCTTAWRCSSFSPSSTSGDSNIDTNVTRPSGALGRHAAENTEKSEPGAAVWAGCRCPVRVRPWTGSMTWAACRASARSTMLRQNRCSMSRGRGGPGRSWSSYSALCGRTGASSGTRSSGCRRGIT